MPAILVSDTDVLRLSAAVNQQRAAGLIPSGGLLVNKSTYFQLMVTGTSTVSYQVIMEASDRDFQSKASLAADGGAFALGAPQYVNGFWVQAFGDMAGAGGGGGSLPDGDTVNQTIQWDGLAWQPGVIPADGTIYAEDDALGANLPTIVANAAKGYPLGVVVIDGTGQSSSGLYMMDGATPVFQLSALSTQWSIAGGAGVGSLNCTTTSSQLNAPSVTNIALNSTRVRMTGPTTTLVDVVAGSLQPFTDNAVSLGASGKRWTEVWAATGTINTSDADHKTAPQAIPDAVLDAIGDVDIVQYKMLDAIAAKGEANARLHAGVIAQQVISAFEARGLDATDYGIVCYDTWPAEDAVLAEDGSVLVPAREAGGMWSVRYDELQMMEMARVRRELSRLSS